MSGVVVGVSAHKATAEKAISGPAKSEKISEAWTEAEKNAPKVKDADKDKFEGPDEPSGWTQLLEKIAP